MTGANARTVVPAAAGLAFFLFYASRLCPDLLLFGDSAELVTAAAVWGVPHAPGYPLFTAVAHGFALLPFGTVPWRIHLTSALFHAGAVAAVADATIASTCSGVAGLAAAAALGLGHPFLIGSLYAEVFPLNDLFFATLLAWALRMRRTTRVRRRSAMGFAACCGVAAAHHPMIALGAPGLALLAGGALRRFVAAERRGASMLVAVAASAAILSYVLVPLAAARRPFLSWGDVHDARSLASLVLRLDYGGPMSPAHAVSAAPGGVRLRAFAEIAARGVGVSTLAIAAYGVAAALARQGRSVFSAAGLALAILVPGPAFAWMNALDVESETTRAYFERFTTMAEVPLAIAFGWGVAAAQAWTARRRLGAPAVLALLAWIAARSHAAWDVSLRAARRGVAFAHDLVLPTPDRALILLRGDAPAAAAAYVCAVEKRCGERIVLSPGMLFLPWAMTQTRRRYPALHIPWSSGPALQRTHEIVSAELGDRPVFVYPDLLVKDPALGEAFHRDPDRLLFRLWPADGDTVAERAAFLASARAMADGQCEGCVASPSSSSAGVADGTQARPSAQESAIAEAYMAAFENHARRAEEVGAFDLAGRLESNVVPPDDSPAAPALSGGAGGPKDPHGGGASRSR